ncbi:serine protease [Lithospermum erythrorhizon]|uniref:Serine protease n=1 Tax=Lithospermum erythrorhizon TaxID=34254 RepID=A0AAV3RUA6_LITER
MLSGSHWPRYDPIKVSHLYHLCLLICNKLSWGQESDEEDVNAVYIVTLKQASSVHTHNVFDQLRVAKGHHHKKKLKQKFGSLFRRVEAEARPRGCCNSSRRGTSYASRVSRVHDSLLKKVLRGGKYLKLYSHHYLINGFVVLITPQQADRLTMRREVSNVVLDFSLRTATTHTPQFLGLPEGAWRQEGGFDMAGEGIVIGFIDTGIDPTHPSFVDNASGKRYPVPDHFSGICEVTRDFPSGSCNRKLIVAHHFAASAINRGIFNASENYASPFDGDGHGT